MIRQLPGLTGSILLALAILVIPTNVHAARCDSGKFRVFGLVLDSAGRPLADARVHVLLDQVSERKFAEEGLRARSTHTDGAGRYGQFIDCELASGDRPSPCAKKPKFLTVAAGRPGYRTTLKVFKLKRLDLTEQAGVCTAKVPELRLSTGF